jgi:hypothetical protein
MKKNLFALINILTLMFSIFTIDAAAQELEPRSLAAAPVKLNILLIAYAYSNGNVLLDSSLPIEDAEARLNTFNLAYATTLNLFGRLAKLDVAIPFSHGNWEGILEGQPASAKRTGFGDPAVRLGINLIGTPALYGREFLTFREKFVLGASLQMRMPLGQYYGDKLVNLGTNRWVFRPTLGAAMRLNRWIFEASLSAWFFTRNGDFFGGTILTQEPMYAIQTHLAYSFRRGFWLAASFGKSRGGKTIVSGVKRSDSQNNIRLGLTLAIPLSGGHGIAISYTSGLVTRYGADFDIFVCAYQYRWGGR